MNNKRHFLWLGLLLLAAACSQKAIFLPDELNGREEGRQPSPAELARLEHTMFCFDVYLDKETDYKGVKVEWFSENCLADDARCRYVESVCLAFLDEERVVYFRKRKFKDSLSIDVKRLAHEQRVTGLSRRFVKLGVYELVTRDSREYIKVRLRKPSIKRKSVDEHTDLYFSWNGGNGLHLEYLAFLPERKEKFVSSIDVGPPLDSLPGDPEDRVGRVARLRHFLKNLSREDYKEIEADSELVVWPEFYPRPYPLVWEIEGERFDTIEYVRDGASLVRNYRYQEGLVYSETVRLPLLEALPTW
ncbi:MAG: hypothetical protein KDC32_05455 [Saprospiraceae bacterium]|nr:hypothetical protein [Saprospiraceae bacterium]MCB0676474.1 hypothetical protein [Saprospiraceae bacterium]MCB0680379.1 hypothetical protein [Saprospiraceae bacterium]